VTSPLMAIIPFKDTEQNRDKSSQTMAERGATRECLNFTFEDTPEGRFIETMFAAQGQLEREQNARQVQQKMRARMETGYWVHNAPVGYRYETIRGRGKVLTPDEPLASIVREGIEGYASGRFQTQAEVKRFFDGFPDFPRNKRGELVQQRVTDILTNPIYTGHICSESYGISWLKGHHEPLISMATFDKVQDRRAGVAKLPARNDIGDDFALRGFVCCASCGTPLRSSWSKGRTKSYPYYLCQTKGCDAYGKSIARDKIEGDVEAVIKSLQPTQNAVALAKDLFRRAWDYRHGQAAKLKASVESHIASIDKQIDGLMERLLDTTNQAVMRRYEEKIESLERDKARYHDQMAQMTGQKRKSYAEQLEPALNIVTKPWKLWASGDIGLRRLVLKLAFADRLHYDRKTGPRTAKFAIPFKALGHIQRMHLNNGAQEKTRTSTILRSLAPEASASTNSATWAGG
jgi:site-specific DNA recombinase